MTNQAVIQSLQNALSELVSAENELSRPHEDVVTLSACVAVRNALLEMMQSYLQAHGIHPETNTNLEDMRELCIGVNPRFREVDFRNVECKSDNHTHCDGKYCLSIANISNCLSVANQVKSIIWNEFHM